MKAVKVLAAAVAAALAAEGACRGLERLERLGAVASPGFELYAVGESTAAGVPYAPEITPAKLVSRILGGRVRGRPIVPIDVARQGESIYPQAEEFESALRRRAFPGGPGAVFVYAGHNDAFDAEQTPFFEYFKEDVLFRSELLKALFFYAEKYRLIPRVRTMQTYEFNLRRVIESSRRAGLTPILATAASNFSGIDPGFPADSAAPGDVELIAAGRALEARGRFAQALAGYRSASRARPELRAYLRYRMALCLGRLGRHRLEAALLRACVEARTGDNFGRARAEQNALIRRLAREYSIPLVDFERIAADASPRGVTGDELFIDGHHPNIKGYALLADALAEAVARSSGGRVRAPIAAAGRLLDDLGCSREGQSRALVESGRWLLSVGARQAYPFQRWSMAADRFRRAAELEPDDFSARFGSALAAAALGGRFVEPNLDWLGERGLFYGGDYDVSTEDFPEAVEKLRAAGVPGPQLLELRRTFRPDPSATGWLARRGRALEFGVVSAARKLRLAMKSSRPEAVERSRPERSDSNRRAGERPSGALAAPRRVRPFDPAYRAELAAWAARTDRPRLAVLLLAAARAADPDPQTRLRIAMIYQSLKDYDRESAVLRELVRDRPTDAEARTDAGLCLDLKGDPEGAASELNAALRLDPKRLSTYLTLAAVDSALGRRGEARRVLDAGLAAEAGSDPRMRALLKDGLRTIPSPR